MVAATMGNKMRAGLRAVLLGGLLALPMACEQIKTEEVTLPAMRWDNHPEGTIWTTRTLDAIDTHAPHLLETVPRDIETWCPGYPEASVEEREAFWTGILSALAKHESTWNPNAVNGDSGACGWFQRYPCPWRYSTDPDVVHADALEQALNGYRYIVHRYRTPHGAIVYHNAHGSY
jgi:hypothetical protein